MAAHSYEDLMAHWGHKIQLAKYGDVNATIECVDCHEIIVSFDKEDENLIEGEGYELDDGGIIEWPDSDCGTIRRRDVDGNVQEVREIDEPEWQEWGDLFSKTPEDFPEERK